MYILLRTNANLVDSPINSAVQDTTDQETLDVCGVDIELARDELDVNASVWFDEFDEDLTRNIVLPSQWPL